MLIKNEELKQMMQNVAELFRNNVTALCEIDSKFGDGDHGITIGKIADLIDKSLEEENQTISEYLEDLGDSIMAVNGGSAGPLYGTLIGGMAIPVGDKTEIDGKLLKEMFKSSLDEMRDISTAKIGDKTMMDALIPAVEAAQNAEDTVEAVLKAAAEGAKKGAKDTENYIAKYGRAKSYKEQTLGTQDAGATSTSLLFEGMASIIK